MADRREDASRCSDEELAALALEGRVPAWNEIARRHTRRVIVALLARGIPLDVAEDLTQEAWLRLVQQQRAGRLKALRLPGLAIAQAGWLARERSRREHRREGILGQSVELPEVENDCSPTDPAEDPERHAARRELVEAIQKELRGCSRRAQQVFRAAYGPGARSHADVACELGMSVQRVRQILCEVRARMRRALEQWKDEDPT